MASRLHYLPRELLLIEADYLAEQGTRTLCSSDPLINVRLCRNPEYSKQLFEREFTKDRKWLRDYFLLDRRYASAEPASIPTDDIDYYEALREARMLVDLENDNNDLRVNIINYKTLSKEDNLTQAIFIACRNNFDVYLHKLIAEMKNLNSPRFDQLPPYFDVATFALRYNRLAIFQALTKVFGSDDELAMRISDLDKYLTDSDDRSRTELLKRNNIYNRKAIAELFVEGSFSFDDMERLHRTIRIDDEFYNYLTGADFDPLSDEMKYKLDQGRKLFTKTLSDYPNTYSYVIGSDNVELAKTQPLPDSNEFYRLAEYDAQNVLEYLTTVPQLYDAAGKFASVLPGLMSETYFTRQQITVFFASSFSTLLATDWSKALAYYDDDDYLDYLQNREYAVTRLYDSDEEDETPADKEQWNPKEEHYLKMLNSNQFQANYRMLVRIFLPSTSADLVVPAVANLLAPDNRAPSENDPDSTAYKLLMLQELMRCDLLINPPYQRYLDYLFDQLAVNPEVSNSVYRASYLPVVFGYVLYMQHYNLLKRLPLQVYTVVAAIDYPTFIARLQENTVYLYVTERSFRKIITVLGPHLYNDETVSALPTNLFYHQATVVPGAIRPLGTAPSPPATNFHYLLLTGIQDFGWVERQL